MLDRSFSTVTLIGRDSGPVHHIIFHYSDGLHIDMMENVILNGIFLETKFTFVCESSLWQQQKKAHGEESSCGEFHLCLIVALLICAEQHCGSILIGGLTLFCEQSAVPEYLH